MKPALLALAVLTGLSSGDSAALDYRAQLKYQSVIMDLPEDSLAHDFSDDPAIDNELDLRLILNESSGGWNGQLDYQLQLRQGDALLLSRQNPAAGLIGSTGVDDDRRIFDLTHILHQRGDEFSAHRLDRLWVGHSSARTVLRIGRQALSWGNGIFYNPMDFFNPFDPAAIDTEYKSGDDMLYSQYLFDSGDDLQAVWVGRRNQLRKVDSRVASLALKYHGFAENREFDLLLAEHFDQPMLAIGASADSAEALWRSDLVLTDTGSSRVVSAVANWSYSWLAWSKNATTTIEYFHNGFGIDDGDYSPAALAAHPELLARLQRGELFSVGENYLSAALTAELAARWIFTASLFNNLDDGSRLLQLFSQHDLQQDLQLLLALNLAGGSHGSEFGGIESGVPGKTLALGDSLIAQLSWYF